MTLAEAQKRDYENKDQTLAKLGIKTAPYDARFPNQNQTLNCWQNYVDYYRCINKKGEDFDLCQYFKFIYVKLCPSTWIEKYDNLRETDCFPAKLD
ncbi:unnamed protein product [Gordionus sp. m RMFG-2023]